MSQAVVGGQNASRLKADLEAKFERKGTVHGAMSGMTYGLYSVILGLATAKAPFATAPLIAASLVAIAINDSLAALWLTGLNVMQGRGKEIIRNLCTFPGMMVCLAALFGGPIANVAYLLGIMYAGATYAMPISALCPVVGAILSRIFMKQKISKRVGIGMTICIIGTIIVSYVKPDGNPQNFYLGIAFSLLAAIGWGAEGMISTFGMSMMDPKIAITIRDAMSGLSILIVGLPIIGGYKLFASAITQPEVIGIMAIGALVCATSFLTWYNANSMCGVAKGMSLNITYVLWGFVWSIIILHESVTGMVVVGGIIVTIGAILVSVNPMDFIRKEEA
ncbi:DMT family transporter [Velocimicrobium porci]|uniref:DMT family transporter n=1 Tax=Velocimicrobium porci TaxID=2606634 RepID=A0A6L5XVY0_9FIRM|nr:DMT family transporter [Velocimicrobium porci]MSS62980.1 DMT family transporter [Velocimicrobium porci]